MTDLTINEENFSAYSSSCLDDSLSIKNENPAPKREHIYCMLIDVGSMLGKRAVIAGDGTIKGTECLLTSCWDKNVVINKYKREKQEGLNFVLFSVDESHHELFKKNDYVSKFLKKDIYGAVFICKECKKNADNLEDLSVEEFEAKRPSAFARRLRRASFVSPNFETIMSSILLELEETYSKFGKSIEENIDLGEIIARYQWMRNKESDQNFGNRVLIRRINQNAFDSLVLPKLKSYGAKYCGYSYEKYIKNDAKFYPYYMCTYNMSLKFWVDHLPCNKFMVTRFDNYSYLIQVPSFECKQAKTWGKLADSNISRERSIKWQQELEKELNLTQPPKSFIVSSPFGIKN